MTVQPVSMRTRFRGFLPVVVDIEAGGFNPKTDALLELAAAFIEMRADGSLARGATHRYHVTPFPGSRLDPASLAFNKIDPFHPLRIAICETDAIQRLFTEIRHAIRDAGCKRAILVGHNPAFDLNFLTAAVERNDIKRNPFHPFSTFDTATLGGVAFGQTVLMRALVASGALWDASSAHSASYDAERSADLFCTVCNQFQQIFESSRRRTEGALMPSDLRSEEDGDENSTPAPAAR